MNRLLIKILYLLELMIIAYGTEYKTSDEASISDQFYDVSGLLRRNVARLEKASRFNDETITQQLNYPNLRKFFFETFNSSYQNSTKCEKDIAYTILSLVDASNQWALKSKYFSETFVNIFQPKNCLKYSEDAPPPQPF